MLASCTASPFSIGGHVLHVTLQREYRPCIYRWQASHQLCCGLPEPPWQDNIPDYWRWKLFIPCIAIIISFLEQNSLMQMSRHWVNFIKANRAIWPTSYPSLEHLMTISNDTVQFAVESGGHIYSECHYMCLFLCTALYTVRKLYKWICYKPLSPEEFLSEWAKAQYCYQFKKKKKNTELATLICNC